MKAADWRRLMATSMEVRCCIVLVKHASGSGGASILCSMSAVTWAVWGIAMVREGLLKSGAILRRW